VMDDIWAAVGQPYDDIMGGKPSIYDNIWELSLRFLTDCMCTQFMSLSL
jgi:hypothetical protein